MTGAFSEATMQRHDIGSQHLSERSGDCPAAADILFPRMLGVNQDTRLSPAKTFGESPCICAPADKPHRGPLQVARPPRALSRHANKRRSRLPETQEP